jgi:hypothetical protein
VCNDQKKSVADARMLGWNFSYRRWVDENQQRQQHRMKDILLTYPLGDGRDSPCWLLSKNGLFTVNSLYRKFADTRPNSNFKHRLKAKFPPKIKMWLWLILHNAIANKDNMKKRKVGLGI